MAPAGHFQNRFSLFATEIHITSGHPPFHLPRAPSDALDLPNNDRDESRMPRTFLLLIFAAPLQLTASLSSPDSSANYSRDGTRVLVIMLD
jgi:hypothetical protein